MLKLILERNYMTKIIKNKTIKDDDCNCGKPLKLTDPKKKIVRKVKKQK